jgi:hypothetical protein
MVIKFSGNLRILKNVCYYGLGLTLHNPRKLHAFTSLPLHSAYPGMVTDALQAIQAADCLDLIRDVIVATKE